jgi:hypothetical protein
LRERGKLAARVPVPTASLAEETYDQ